MCSTQTLTKHMERKLDGNFTRMLPAVLNKSWRQHPTKQQLYGHLTPISKTIPIRLARHTGHYWKSKGDLISDVLPWNSSHGQAKVGRPAWTYLKQHCTDTRCSMKNRLDVIDDRDKEAGEGQGNLCLRHAMIMMIYIYIYIFRCVWEVWLELLGIVGKIFRSQNHVWPQSHVMKNLLARLWLFIRWKLYVKSYIYMVQSK